MKIFLFFILILIFALTGCGKNPIFSLLPEAVTDGGGQSIDLPFEENFDTCLSFVNGTNGWSISTSGNPELSIDTTIYKGVRSLKVYYPQGTGTISVKKNFSPCSKVIAEEYFYSNKKSAIEPVILGLYVNNKLAVSVKRGGLNGMFIVSYYNTSTETLEQSGATIMVSATWYKIKLKLDTTTTPLWTWTLWINDTLELTGTLNEDKTLSGLVDYFGFESTYTLKDDDDIFYIDEIKVTEEE
ncbi:MAG: hypothetical protein ABH873_00020 [Candidatus Firestonebacteria bacterium]